MQHCAGFISAESLCRNKTCTVLHQVGVLLDWYCDNIVYPFIVQLKQDEIDKACFQKDGAMAHTAHMSMALLDDMFADRTTYKII